MPHCDLNNAQIQHLYGKLDAVSIIVQGKMTWMSLFADSRKKYLPINIKCKYANKRSELVLLNNVRTKMKSSMSSSPQLHTSVILVSCFQNVEW